MKKKAPSKKRNPQNIRFWVIILLIFITVFSVFGLVPLQERYQRMARLKSNQTVLAATKVVTENNEQPLISGKPTRIAIPAVNIDLPIVEGYYYPQSQSWTLTLDKAQFAAATSVPNNKSGNTFIYAHNRKEVFINLPKVVPGDIATVTTDNGHVFTYIFKESYETKPNDTSIFSYKGDPRLTLQTCSGAWYQNRQLFGFELVSVE